jgi:hypothetical protein
MATKNNISEPNESGAPAETANTVTNTASGTVAGHSAQAATVHGGVHFHTERGEPRPLIPRQLPPRRPISLIAKPS